MMKDLPVDPSDHRSTSETSLRGSLLVRLRDNDEGSWRQLWELYEPVVGQWCARAGLGVHDAADVAQEVFRSVTANLDRFRREKPGDTFRGWLWTITRNKINDHWRTRRDAPDAVGGTDAHRRLAELPDDLSGDWSSATGTGPADGLFRRALGMSAGAVYVAKSRVLARLRAELGDVLE